MDVFRFLFYRRSWSLHRVGFYRKLRTPPRNDPESRRLVRDIARLGHPCHYPDKSFISRIL